MGIRVRDQERLNLASLIKDDRAIHTGLIALAIAVVWLRPISSSFSLDELGTYWVIRNDLPNAISLALRYQGQSPAYYLIPWAARVVGRGSEAILRLPSLVAASLATFLMARLGRRLFGVGAGWTSAVVFAVTPVVAFSAIDARPYAFAYLFLAAATLSLINFLDRAGPRWAVAYGASVAATIHSHYLFALAVLGHLPYLVSRWRDLHRSPARYLGLAIGVAAALTFPLVVQIPYLAEHARIPDLPLGRVSFRAFLEALTPMPLVAGGFLGMLLARCAGPIDFRSKADRRALALAIGLWLAPPLGLSLFFVFSGLNLLWVTYARSSAIGMALLLGGLLAAIAPPRANRISVLVVVVIGLLSGGGRWHSDQDWRGAAAQVNAIVDDRQIPVLMQAAFIEGAHVEFFADPEYRSLLLAQLTRYPVEGMVLPIPYNLTDKSKTYLEDKIVRSIEDADHFVLVTLDTASALVAWLEGRLQPMGFEATLVGEHGAVQVMVFERRGRA